ncbi:MAG: nickel-dependent hydrogenase large subunit [Candidatus Diapherotrites archaeon]|nr:nickel-dependent hydrogenase large subunit [Candidatus Diapherotrites archaeon]
MSDYLVPFGPQHPAIKEPISLRLKLSGSTVEGVDAQLGYIHRGVEKIFERENINNALYLAERICGICSYAHASAYTRAMESMMHIRAPPRVQYLRTMFAELERLHSHLLWAGFMCHEIGFETLFQLFWREREQILDVFERYTGNRVHHSYNKLGTVRYDIEDEDYIREQVHSILPTVKSLRSEIKGNGVVAARFKKVGPVTHKQAIEYCLVGPPARACGVKNDIRKLDPYEAYGKTKFKQPIYKSGDSYARTMVRLDEIFESVKIIDQCLRDMPATKVPKHSLKALPQGEGYGRVEAPRGENFHYYIVKDSKITRAKIRPPTLAVFPALETMMLGAHVGDVPVIVASIDPCIGCMERITVTKGRRTETLTEQEFRRKYCG